MGHRARGLPGAGRAGRARLDATGARKNPGAGRASSTRLDATGARKNPGAAAQTRSCPGPRADRLRGVHGDRNPRLPALPRNGQRRRGKVDLRFRLAHLADRGRRDRRARAPQPLLRLAARTGDGLADTGPGRRAGIGIRFRVRARFLDHHQPLSEGERSARSHPRVGCLWGRTATVVADKLSPLQGVAGVEQRVLGGGDTDIGRNHCERAHR